MIWPTKSYYEGPRDTTMELMREVVYQHRLSSFSAFAFDISIFGPIRPRNENHTYESYLFEPDGKPARKMGVKLSVSSTVLVRLHGRWRSFNNYIKELPILHDPNERTDSQGNYDSELCTNHQARWWIANRYKSFKLIDLPGEIRNKIYGYYFPDVVEPYPTARCWRGNCVAERHRPQTMLLQVNRQVHREARGVLYFRTCFMLRHARLFTNLVCNPALPIFHLRKLTLALNHLSYLKLFGIHLEDSAAERVIDYQPVCSVLAIRVMPLSHLELIMPPPKEMLDISWLDGGCQKTVVEWILDAAWPYIKGQPIILKGYVKRTQKLAFDEKVRQARKDRLWWAELREKMGLGVGDGSDGTDETGGGVKIDEAGGQETAGGTNVEGSDDGHEDVRLPPLCVCTMHCHTSTLWDVED